jgi:hypothetical protein
MQPIGRSFGIIFLQNSKAEIIVSFSSSASIMTSMLESLMVVKFPK